MLLVRIAIIDVAAEQHFQLVADRQVRFPHFGILHVEAQQGKIRIVLAAIEPGFDRVRPEFVDQAAVVADRQHAGDAGEKIMALAGKLHHRFGMGHKAGGQAVVLACIEEKAVGYIVVELRGHRFGMRVLGGKADHDEGALVERFPEFLDNLFVVHCWAPSVFHSSERVAPAERSNRAGAQSHGGWPDRPLKIIGKAANRGQQGNRPYRHRAPKD